MEPRTATRHIHISTGPARSCTSALSLAALAALAITQAACSAAHGPKGADTNTSWLQACIGDGDCAGDARCLDHLCTLSCSDEQPGLCRSISARAICDELSATCDLPCGDDTECSVLGASLVCQSGRCREPSALSASDQTLELATEADADGPWYTMAMDSAWLGDRWRVAVQSIGPVGTMVVDDSVTSFTSINVTDVFPDGRSQRDQIRNESLVVNLAGPLLVGQDGRVLEQVREKRLGGEMLQKCQARFYGPSSLAQLQVLEDDCSGNYLPASLNAAGDWLLVEQSFDAVYARLYQPEPQTLGSRVEVLRRTPFTASLSVRVDAAQQVSMYWAEAGGFQASAVVPKEALFATPPLANAWFDMSVGKPWGTLDGRRLPWTLSGGGWLVPTFFERIVAGTAGRWLQVALQQSPDSETEPRQVTLELELKETQLGDKAVVALLPVPERNLLAYLHVDAGDSSSEGGYTVWLHVFDSEGVLQTAPVRIASSADEIMHVQLSWSGEAFLATWSEGLIRRPFARIVRIAPEVDASSRL